MRNIRTMRLPAVWIAIAISGAVAAACQASPTTPSAAASQSTPTASPVAPSNASPTQAAEASPTPASSTATGLPLEDWSGVQLYLLAGMDPKTRPSCGNPARLPDGAEDGVECHPAGLEVIGFYAFTDAETMTDLYFKRLQQYGVAKAQDGCHFGSGELHPGEADDLPDFGLPVETTNRYGCYVDENGRANARFTFPSESKEGGVSVYVGAVGRNGSIGQLFHTLFPDRESQGVGCDWCTSSLWQPARAT